MTAHEKAQSGLGLLKDAVWELLKGHSTGLTNGDIAHQLGLESHRLGKQRGWLSWSILSLLMNEGKVVYERKLYRATSPHSQQQD